MSVDPERQRQGVGSMLLEMFCREMDENDFQRIRPILAGWSALILQVRVPRSRCRTIKGGCIYKHVKGIGVKTLKPCGT